MIFNYGADTDIMSVKSDDEMEHKEELEEPTALTKWQSIPFRNRLKMRLAGIGYFSDDGSRDFGTLMHEIVSQIRTIDDLEDALDRKAVS